MSEPVKTTRYIQYRPYSEAEICELKTLNADKPDDCSVGDWTKSDKLGHRHQALAYLAAAGVRVEQIAEELDYTPQRVTDLLSNSAIKDRVTEIQTQYWGANAQKRFDALLPKAIEVTAGILENAQEKNHIRLQAAGMLMDRALGKPMQKTEVKTSFLAEIHATVDQQLAQLKKVVELEDPQMSEYASIVAEFRELDKGVVGKRGQEESKQTVQLEESHSKASEDTE